MSKLYTEQDMVEAYRLGYYEIRDLDVPDDVVRRVALTIVRTRVPGLSQNRPRTYRTKKGRFRT